MNSTYSRRLSAFAHSLSPIIDEIGFKLFDDEEASSIFDDICKHYEYGSIVLSSNKTYSEWADVFSGNEVIATAILDQLLRHSKSFALRGDGYRKKEFKEGRQQERNHISTVEIEAAPGTVGNSPPIRHFIRSPKWFADAPLDMHDPLLKGILPVSRRRGSGCLSDNFATDCPCLCQRCSPRSWD